MIRFVLRFVGFWLLAGAFVALVYDGTRSIAGEQIILTKMTESWNALNPGGLTAFEAGVRRWLSPWAWDSLVGTVLEAPTAVVLAALGALLLLLGRKKPPLIGYARR